jgi:hypothetical protein
MDDPEAPALAAARVGEQISLIPGEVWVVVVADRMPSRRLAHHLRTEPVSTGQVLEVACDESGYEGEHLIGATTDVFAHASVRLRTQAAADCVQEIRDRIRSPAQEYKSTHLLREKHRSVLEWLLGPSGPIHGNARVHLIEKVFFAVSRLADLLVGEMPHPAGAGRCQDRRAKAMAVTLYREGRRAFGPRRWEALLESFNDLMRAKSRPGNGTSVDSFFRMVEDLRLAGTPVLLDEIMGLLWHARPRLDALRAELLGNPNMIPPLDPLIPAILIAVLDWSEGGELVSIVHDQHTALTEERIAQLREIFGKPHPIRLVDSRSDPRVQIADFLAGVARKIASNELNDRGDAELTALLRPYVDRCSIWGDERSWSLLAPASTARS